MRKEREKIHINPQNTEYIMILWLDANHQVRYWFLGEILFLQLEELGWVLCSTCEGGVTGSWM